MFKWIKDKYNKAKNYDIMENAIGFVQIVSDKDSKIYCKKCKRMLPLFRLILKAKSVKNNQIFQFKCKCGYINMIKKEVE